MADQTSGRRGDVTVLDTHGESVRLLDLASDHPILVVFLRHFG